MCLPAGARDRVEQALLGQQHERPLGMLAAPRPPLARRRSRRSVPPRWTVPAPRAARGAPRDRAVERPVDLEDARGRSESVAARGGSPRAADRPRCASSCRGVTSNSTARARGSSSSERDARAGHDLAAERARDTRPARRRSAATRRAATGQPTAWPAIAEHEPERARVGGSSSGSIECAASPANSARARSPRNRDRASPVAGRSAGRPKRAIASGCRGSRSGASSSAMSASASRDERLDQPAIGPAVGPPSAVGGRLDERSSSDRRAVVERVRERRRRVRPTPGRAPPAAARGRTARPAASGCTAEQTSWTKPGRVSSAERQPPPTVSARLEHRTDRPARARVMAAARPFGPAPTTTASRPRQVSRRLAGDQAPSAHRADRRAQHVDRRADRRGVPHVAPPRPLALLVDADDRGVDIRVGMAEVRGEGAERVRSRSGSPGDGRPS